ncbi:DHA2 family efflux MFS transporter permease subunit [Nonomuraea sp. MCN248]|uniref:DHA2 family efflux MFS transporter permease subunit n=1 Tax=Nonomuraea corallina TaxID=2989783 RepID=A0ABT4S8I6_9ACTN|nr:DHA2 family efflux MFS transporter permease subunit [Nonomuraea corallina]MDA0633484.1 DHA2 family efflux MFS transporter permease subunit [Nonomuraea corallina]
MSSNLSRLVAVVLLGGMLGILNSTMVAVGIDALAAAFGTSLSAIGWVSTGFLLAVTAAIPVTSWAVDRFGARRLWLFGLLVFLAGSLGAGLAWDTGSLIAFRAVQGLGAGVLDPLVLTLLARAAGPHRAGRVMGLMGVVLSLGPVLGPLTGGALLQAFSWKWMFLLNVPVGVVAYLLALRVIPADDPPAGRRARLDVTGVALLAPGFVALMLALSQAAEQVAFGVWQVLVPLAAGVALLGGYGLHARRGEPLIDPRLFARRSFSAAVVVMGLVGLATFATLFALPLYFRQVHGVGALAAGMLVAPVGAGAAVAMPLAGRLSDRLGARGLALGGAAVAVVSGLAFTQVGPGTGWAWPVVAGCAMGLGLGFVGAPTMGSLYRLLPAPLIPQGSAVLYMLNQLGAALGIAVVTLIVQTAGDPLGGMRGVFWFALAMVTVILAAVPLLPGCPAPQARAVTERVGSG